MHQRRARKVIIDKADLTPNAIQGEPEQEVLGTILRIQGDHLVLRDAEVVHKPVPDPLEVLVEALVRPAAALEFQEQRLGSVARVVLDAVVHEQPVLRLPLRHELLRLLRCIVQSPGGQVVPDVVFRVQVGCGGGERAGHGDGGWDRCVSCVL